MKHFVWLAVFAAGSVCAQQAPLEFKGISLGAAKQEVRAKYHIDPCAPGEGLLAGSESCKIIGVDSYAGVERPRISVTMRFRDDVLVSVYVKFPATEFEAVAGAFAEKYGRPTAVENGQMQNSFGARYASSTHRWVRKDGGVTVSQHAGNLNEGAVHLVSEQGVQAAERQRPPAAARKRDL